MDYSRPSTSHHQPTHYFMAHGPAPPVPSNSYYHSPNSSLSSRASSSDLHHEHQFSHPRSPSFEEDGRSLRSAKLNVSPRWRGFRNIFTRRQSSDATETSSRYTPPVPSPTQSFSQARRPSLPKFASFSNLPASRKHSFGEASVNKPVVPGSPTQELSVNRCYYFAARNCNGWVMGGAHGDACEQCLQLGFTGMP